MSTYNDTTSITVFIADDHAVVRDGLRLLLESQIDIKVAGDAADGRQTVAQGQNLCPSRVAHNAIDIMQMF
jgi:DNA-binding NarL/FixJ family response regulator